MSGGHFDYKQYGIQYLADSIQEELDEPTFNHSEQTIVEFKKAIRLLNESFIYTHRIDWYLSCDDSETTFHERLQQDLENETIRNGI